MRSRAAGDPDGCRQLLEGLDVTAVKGYDRRRRLFFWNSAIERLHGWTREEALGRHLEELIIPALGVRSCPTRSRHHPLTAEGAGRVAPLLLKTHSAASASYTMPTINADAHPLMSRMHKPDPTLGPDKQDKRSVIPVELEDVDRWLSGSIEQAKALLSVAPVEHFSAGPVTPT